MATGSQDHRFYSVRRLNPFRGTAQVLLSEDCRAISLDGVEWEIQVQAHPPEGLWATRCRDTLQFLRFGTWRARCGLRRIPANPLIDFADLQQRVDKFLDLLVAALPRLPFPLADHYELWLLDGRSRHPIALLASRTRQPDSTIVRRPAWVCGNRNGDDFHAPNWDEERPKHPKDTNPYYHIGAMERLVRSASGHPVAQWFQRHRDGSGNALPHPLLPELDNRTLKAHQFPLLTLHELWDDCYERELTRDCLNWLAPRLLCLQNLPDSTRRRLEHAARQNALEVERLWRLYPKLLDPGMIQSARVEARMRLAFV